MSIELTSEVKVCEVTEEESTRPGWRIEGPFYLEDSEGNCESGRHLLPAPRADYGGCVEY